MKKQNIIFLFWVLFFTGCASLKPIPTSEPVENVVKKLKENITVNKSSKWTVRNLLGEPDFVSVYESSSIEEDISKIPLIEQIKHPFESEFFPYETWNYIYEQKTGKKDPQRTIKVMGISVFSKDVKTVSVFFNRDGKVLGYNIISHYVK